MTVSDALLADVRNYLDISWDDTAGDKKIRGIILNGMSYLNDAAGDVQDYECAGMARALLLDYARYVRSGALDDFTKNYVAELNMLREKNEVAAYVKSQTPDI